MTKDEIYELLNEKGLWYEVSRHKAVYNMEELKDVKLPYPSADAKNLFIRDDKHKCYYLITLKGDKKMDLKEFRRKHNTRPLSFASNEDLYTYLGLFPGSVTPLGLFNDKNYIVNFYCDEYFVKDSDIIGCHPNDNTETLWIKTKDLIELLAEYGHNTIITDL